MEKRRFAQIALALTLIWTAGVSAQESTESMSDTARTYLQQALDLMQTNALHRKSIDWEKLRSDTLTHAKGAKTPQDTYTAIAYGLSQLQEHHSFLQLPDSMTDEQKKAMYTEMNKARPRTKMNTTPFSSRQEIDGHIDRRKGKTFAHVIIPHCGAKYAEWEKNKADFQEFADKLHAKVLDLLAQKPDGWIVDLRGNDGGNMWPMLAGIGLVAGDGKLGAFEQPDDSMPWYYAEGKAGLGLPAGGQVSAAVEKPPLQVAELPWVAILFDQGTASSGEAIAISFAGRSRERSFGDHTGGYSTANDRYPLSDGAALFLCVGVDADRNGKRYEDGLDPDVKVASPEVLPEESKDAALLAAEDWLGQQK